MTQETYEAALRYTQLGFIVHPLHAPDTDKNPKVPMLSGWADRKEPFSEADLKNYFLNTKNNIGMVCGAASGVTVVDFDDLNFYGQLTEGIDTDNFLVSSHRKEGEDATRGHFVFKHDPDLMYRIAKKERKSVHLSGIDILSGNKNGGGSNVVLPPSVHPSGEIYRFNKEIESIDDIPVMPPEFKKRLLGLIKCEDELQTCVGKSRNWIKEFLANPSVLHSKAGRRCMLAMTAELLDCGLSREGVHFLAKIVYREDYDKKRASEELDGVKPMHWKPDTLIQEFPEYCNEENTRSKGRGHNGDRVGVGVGQTENQSGSDTELVNIPVADVFGEKYAGTELAHGYGIDEHGLYRREKDTQEDKWIRRYLSHTPFMVSAEIGNIDSREEYIRVTYKKRTGEVEDVEISLHNALRSLTVTELMKYGILFTGEQAKSVTSYLMGCVEANKTLPRMIKCDSNGWKKAPWNETIFVCGNKYYTADAERDIIPADEKQLAGLGQHGDMMEWAEGFDEAAQNPLLRFKIYTALAAALIRPLRVQSFLQDHYGESGNGKTCSSDLSMTVWGDPDKLRFNGDTTKTAAEHNAAMMCDLPLYMDETGTQNKQEALSELAYMIANEQGRGRGKKDGGVRATLTWKTIAMTTGEKSIVNEKGFTGQQVRVMPLTNRLTPDGSLSPAITKAIDASKKSHGHIGPLVVQEYLKNPDKYKELMKETERRYSRNGEAKVTENRMLRQFAVIHVAGVITEKIFETLGMRTMDPDTVVTQFMNEINEQVRAENYAIRALRIIMDYRQTSARNFLDVEKREAELEAKQREAEKDYGDNYDPNLVSLPTFTFEIHGFERKSIDCVDFVPQKLNEFLTKEGIDSRRATRELYELGVIRAKPDSDGRIRYQWKVVKTDDVTVTRVIRIDITEAEKALKKACGESESWKDNWTSR